MVVFQVINVVFSPMGKLFLPIRHLLNIGGSNFVSSEIAASSYCFPSVPKTGVSKVLEVNQ